MPDEPDFDSLWDALLSREPERVRAAYLALDEASRGEVLKHLRRMVGEAGWHPLQRKSARAALKALKGAE